MKKRKNDPELVGERDDLGIEVEELDVDGEVDQDAIHEYAIREGAPAEVVMEREDKSTSDPFAAETDPGLEDLEGQSILDPYAESREKDPVELKLDIDAEVDEADVLKPKPGEFEKK